MHSDNWGKCKDCKMWQIEPGAAIEGGTMGICIADELESFRLRVSGDSGCGVFAPGEAKRAEGSGAVPPTPAAVH